MFAHAALVAGAAAGVFGAPLSALAPPGLAELETHADDVTIDTERRELELRGHVEVDAAPFHLRSDALRLRRTGRGIEVEGEGTLAFCPCLGTPLTLYFHDALVGPPSDLVLRQARLEVYGVPVFWLPYFWLRAPDRVGLLPPELAWRAKDGFFAGAGLHAPWGPRDRELGLDLRAGGYVKGGFAVDADVRTPSSRTKVRWDWLDTGGLAVDARGSEGKRYGAAWDVSTLRGARALAATRSLDEASQLLDRTRGESFVREGAVTFASGATVLSRRGSEAFEAHAGGPMALASVSDALGRFGTASAAVRGGAMRDLDRRTLAFSGLDAHLTMGHPIGVVATSVDARGELAVVSNGERGGRFASARADVRVALPLVRSFASADPSDPWRHRLEPRATTTVLVESQTGDGTVGRGLVPLFVRGRDADAEGVRQLVVPEAGLASAFGRWGARDGFELDVVSGVALGEVRAPIARGHLAAIGTFVGASAEAGARLGSSEGVAVSSRVRVGAERGLHVEARASGRSGIDPTLARVLAPSVREAPSAYFASVGYSAGGALVVPWTRHVTTRVGADADLTARTLLGVRGSIDLRDTCGCVTLRVFGSERLGREGLDLWVALELGEAPAKN